MTALQIEMVQASWKMVAAKDTEATASLLYQQLVSIVPQLKIQLSGKHTKEPSRKVLLAINYIVRKLHNKEIVMNKVEHISSRHINYDVQDEQYILAGKSLIALLAAGLGDRWSRNMENAWINCYTTLAEIIMQSTRIHEADLVFYC